MDEKGKNEKNSVSNIPRREFIGKVGLAGATAYGLTGFTGSQAMGKSKNVRISKNAIQQRIAFDVWPNDTRNEPVTDAWPSMVFDEKTKDGIRRALDVQAEAGYNIVDLAGIMGGHSWPMDIISATSKDKDAFFSDFVKLCHQRDMQFIFAVGIYSWGFDEIIKNDPEVSGPNPQHPNPHALCASREKSWEWQKKVIDFLMQYEADGYHLESGDLHICSCEDCLKIAHVAYPPEVEPGREGWIGLVDYHCRINKRSAQYIRSKKPDALLVSVMGNWADAINVYDFTQKDVADMADLVEHIDCLYDQGHNQPYVRPQFRPGVIKKLGGKYGTSGGTRVYPPQNTARDQWFLPYTMRTGTSIKKLHAMGGNGVMYYQGPVINPGVEANIDFGGRLMCNVDRDLNDVLSESLEHLYKPKKVASLKKLVSSFRRTEDGFYDAWPGETKSNPRRPAEIYIAAAFNDKRFFDDKSRGTYRAVLIAVQKDLGEIENDFTDDGRIVRIQTCIGNVIKQIETIGYV